MSGFLGNPIAEAIYNEIGVLYTSIFLIPMRIIMWSVGTTYFVADEKVDKKKVAKNVLTHPCPVSYTHLDVYKRQGMYFLYRMFPVPYFLLCTVTRI